MAGFDFGSLTGDVSEAEPCGPDLDLEGDPNFLNFVARCEGLLPASFFTRSDEGDLIPFDRSAIDFPAEFKALDKLLGDTRDFRLLTLYVRLLALNRDLQGVSAAISSIAALASEKWEHVNPKGEDGDYSFRSAILQALDDMPTIILPLQHLPLATSRRSGAVSYRTVMVARGEAKGRSDEAVLDMNAIERIFAEEDFEALLALRDRWKTIGSSIDAIRIVSTEKAGFEQSVVLERLPDLVTKILSVIDPIVVARDPNAASPVEAVDSAETGDAASYPVAGTAPAAVAGEIKDVRAAAAALAAIGKYYQLFEPSNPNALIVRQAQDLVGKSFVEVLKALVPSDAESAKISIGTGNLFALTYSQLQTSHEAIAGTILKESDQAGAGAAASVASILGPATGGDPAPAFEVGSRQQATAVLDQVAGYFRRCEPSSPIPLLIERGRSLGERDFISILKDVLPGLVDRAR